MVRALERGRISRIRIPGRAHAAAIDGRVFDRPAGALRVFELQTASAAAALRFSRRALLLDLARALPRTLGLLRPERALLADANRNLARLPSRLSDGLAQSRCGRASRLAQHGDAA